MKKFLPFLLLIPLALLVFVSFLGCGTGGGGGGGPVATPYLYVVGESSREVFVLNPDDLSVEKLILLPTGGKGKWASLSPDGKRIYVSDNSAGKVYVINTETATYDKTITTTYANRGIGLNADGTLAVAGQYFNGIELLDTANDVSVTNVTLPLGAGAAFGVAQNPVNGNMYIANAGSGSNIYSYSIEASSLTLVSTIGSSAGKYSFDVVFPPGSDQYFVTRTNGWSAPGSVEVYNRTTDAVVKVIGGAGSTFPYKMTASPDGQKIYISNSDQNRIDIVDVQNPTAMDGHTFAFINSTAHTAVSPDSSKVYILADNATPKTVVIKADQALNVISSVELPSNLGNDGAIIYVP